eukprot:TRINITY_DN27823_c0_g1_i1.p3 TRINITY_DN27823_c0_g1~~TRINITY_DN27823_c0_g1_i1.p3  ORF type:complete len:121 (+),score=26.25 TRINITY_DN27823_c0_g1_i1:182-544(+)
MARVNWATFLLRRVVLPSMDVHMKYFRKKIAFDMWLENFSAPMQALMAVTAGSAAFLLCLPFVSTESDRWLVQMITETRRTASDKGMSYAAYTATLDNCAESVRAKVTTYTATEQVANPD